MKARAKPNFQGKDAVRDEDDRVEGTNAAGTPVAQDVRQPKKENKGRVTPLHPINRKKQTEKKQGKEVENNEI